ncbi:zn-finger domain-containing protein [Gigaspora margarita]|uniref:Zn-finger domain-containing protein n=1 Tax=Gigaspora margarita TaxID=4874 RepID=A0A8H4AYR5_GIGMA|nr:zn-finger domain-containing protein [Gigaspora margarita]
MEIYNEFTEREDIESFNYSDSQSNASNEEYYSDSQSDAFNEESDLSDILEVDTNECIEYNDLLSNKPKDPEDIFQEFPSKEYAEFMNIITRFHVQDTLTNAFIKFFNKYSNRNDRPLPSTSKVGHTFIENLNLPNFGWRKEVIFEYEGLEYALEFRTVLDGIHQILLNNSITEEFVIEYKMSTDKVSGERQYSDMFDSEWWKNVEQNIPIGTSKKYSAKFRAATRKLFHRAFAAMLRPLRSLSNTGVHLYVNGNLKWFYPYLALIISDWPEACSMCAIFGLPNCSRPCHFCLVDRNAMNNVLIKEKNIIIRNENATKDYLR